MGLLGASAGSCVRTADFVSVIKEKLASEIRKGTDMLERLENAKRDGTAKPRQIDSITQAVSRAIGGAFKGEMGGVNREEEDDRELKQMDVLAFLQYAMTQDWEDLLQMDGSFMITQDSGASGSGAGNAQPPSEVVEL